MPEVIYAAREFSDGKWHIETSESHGDGHPDVLLGEVFDTELEALDRIAQLIRPTE